MQVWLMTYLPPGWWPVWPRWGRWCRAGSLRGCGSGRTGRARGSGPWRRSGLRAPPPWRAARATCLYRGQPLNDRGSSKRHHIVDPPGSHKVSDPRVFQELLSRHVRSISPHTHLLPHVIFHWTATIYIITTVRKAKMYPRWRRRIAANPLSLI